MRGRRSSSRPTSRCSVPDAAPALRRPQRRERDGGCRGGASRWGFLGDAVAEGLRSFPGVAHRLESGSGSSTACSTSNDSKATNVASAVAGVRAFDGGVRLIAGGRPKQESFAPLAEAVADRCVAVYVIGEAAERLADELAPAAGSAASGSSAPGTLEAAVAEARSDAQPGEVVLLSPACASFDAFKDFEERGNRFRELVEDLSLSPSSARKLASRRHRRSSTRCCSRRPSACSPSAR